MRRVVTRFDVSWEYGGSNCPIVDSQVKGSIRAPIAEGKFSIANPALKGTFSSPTRASGKGRFDPDPATKPACKASNVTWQATPQAD